MCQSIAVIILPGVQIVSSWASGIPFMVASEAFRHDSVVSESFLCDAKVFQVHLSISYPRGVQYAIVWAYNLGSCFNSFLILS